MTAASLDPLLLVALACGLDRVLGDPPWCLHPVVVMGWWIGRLRRLAERWAGDDPRRLRLAGATITLLLVAGSGLVGWALERLALGWPLASLALLIALASALAGRSLSQAVRAVLAAEQVADLPLARQRLSWIVGRDTDHLEAPEILRAAAETASENAVDGVFAPLFWMLVGAGLWCAGLEAAPGPLALAWMFKASSTLDSMLGYRRGRLRWLGTAGARLDDLLTWLPCRLVALTLPLLPPMGAASAWRRFLRALREGAPDPSPNAGVSQAAFALAAAVRLGGVNRYQGQERAKPLLAQEFAPPDRDGVERILRLTGALELAWLLAAITIAIGLSTLAASGQ